MPPPLRTVVTVGAPLLRILLLLCHQVSGPLFFAGVCSSLGYCMECIKLLSSQVREAFLICSAFFFLTCRLTTLRGDLGPAQAL